MARKFDAGADVQVSAGNNFKKAAVGSHSAMLDGVIHLGTYQDVFTKKNVEEIKKPCNFALAIFTLLGREDINEDGTRIRAFHIFPLKQGSKARMTKLLDAIDPNEEASGFDECIGNLCSVSMVGSNEKADDGSPKYVNFGGVSAPDTDTDVIDMLKNRIKSEGLETIGHIKFDNLTEEVIKQIPSFLIRQYILSEKKGKNLSYEGSKVEKLINKIRETDPTFAMKASDDEPEESVANEVSETDIPDDVESGLTQNADDVEY